MSANPYESPSSSLQKESIAALEEGGYVTRVQRRWETFHLFFAVAVGYVSFALCYLFIVSIASDIEEHLSGSPEWIGMIAQLVVALTLQIPVGLGAVYLALKVTRKWRQFGLAYSATLIFMLFMFFGRQVWHPIPLGLLVLITPAALGAMFATRCLRGIKTFAPMVDSME